MENTLSDKNEPTSLFDCFFSLRVNTSVIYWQCVLVVNFFSFFFRVAEPCTDAACIRLFCIVLVLALCLPPPDCALNGPQTLSVHREGQGRQMWRPGAAYFFFCLLWQCIMVNGAINSINSKACPYLV